MTLELRESEGGTVIRLKVRPQAGRDGIGTSHGGALRVHVSPAPERGKATRAALVLLARALGLPAASLRLLTGATSPDKSVWVPLTAPDVHSKLRS